MLITVNDIGATVLLRDGSKHTITQVNDNTSFEWCVRVGESWYRSDGSYSCEPGEQHTFDIVEFIDPCQINEEIGIDCQGKVTTVTLTIPHGYEIILRKKED